MVANSPVVLQQENITAWTFDELPELLEVQQGKQTLIGYPALVDKQTHCVIEVFDDPDEAARIHHIGLRRLFALQMREQLKFLEKNIPGLQQMGMQFMSLGSQEELREQIITTALDRAFMQSPLPKNSGEFNTRREEGKARLNLLAKEVARTEGTCSSRSRHAATIAATRDQTLYCRSRFYAIGALPSLLESDHCPYG